MTEPRSVKSTEEDNESQNIEEEEEEDDDEEEVLGSKHSKEKDEVSLEKEHSEPDGEDSFEDFSEFDKASEKHYYGQSEMDLVEEDSEQMEEDEEKENEESEEDEDEEGEEEYGEEEEEEDETDEETGESLLDNLTLAQLETLLSKKEREQRRSKKKVHCLLMKKEWLELKKKRTMSEEETLEETIQLLNEEEAYLEQLMKRISSIKKFMKTPQKHKGAGRFDASAFPQVILCTPWEDSRAPKVVVCSTPREGKMDSLTKEFLKVLSPEQLAIIEKEKQWMALECGKIRLQIAGIKGRVKVVTRENDVLKTLVDTTDSTTGGHIKVVMPDDMQKPCYGATGVPDKAHPCPKYAPKHAEEIPLEIKLSSMAVPNRRSIGEELRYVEKKINELQKDLDRAVEEKHKLDQQKREVEDLNHKTPHRKANGESHVKTRHSITANNGSCSSLRGMA